MLVLNMSLVAALMNTFTYYNMELTNELVFLCTTGTHVTWLTPSLSKNVRNVASNYAANWRQLCVVVAVSHPSTRTRVVLPLVVASQPERTVHEHGPTMRGHGPATIHRNG